MKQIINGKEYDTDTATLLASNRFWDGSNFERNGRNTYLYKTPNGRYFTHHTTQWQGERNTIEAIEVDEAKALYEELPEHESGYEQAFGVKPEAA
jgi:hypothetical protein